MLFFPTGYFCFFCLSIALKKKNNYISFTRWDDMNSEAGILYLIEGNEPKNEFIIRKFEKLYLDNWFYYVEQDKIQR